MFFFLGRLVRRNRNYDHDDAEDNKDSVMEHLEGSETVSKYSPAKGNRPTKNSLIILSLLCFIHVFITNFHINCRAQDLFLPSRWL